MLADERHEAILAAIAARGRVQNSELVAQLGVSEVTVRRDLGELEAAGRLVRVHGGALQVGASGAASAASVGTIGVVLPSTATYFAELLRSIESYCAARRVRPILVVTDYDLEVERSAIARLVAHGVSGLLLTTVLGDAHADELRGVLDGLPVPTVLMERGFSTPTISRDLPHVRTDHAHGARLALRHLGELGHRRIGLATLDTPTAGFIRVGFEDGLRELGLGLDYPFFPLSDATSPRELRAAIAGFLGELADGGTTGLLVHNDEHAIRLVEIASALGIRVPTDLSVIAYDDTHTALPEVSLTAVSPPKQRIALEAARLLFSILDDESATRPVTHTSLLPDLVIRNSTAPPVSTSAE